MGRTLYDKIWDEHVVHTEDDGTAVLYIDRHLVHEVTSPQAFEGLELAGRKVWRAVGQPGGERPQRADHRPLARHRRSDLAPAGRHARRQLRPLGITQFKMNDRAPGHRPRHRAGAGRDAAGHDGRLRRLAHLDPRRLRRAGARHRHQRGRARARHADAAGAQGEEHAGPRRRQAAARLQREGHRARDHRQDRHRRRHRLHDRVRRQRDPRAQHGRPHDGLQHGHRGRCARRPDRRRRDHARLRARPAVQPDGRRMGAGRGATGARCSPTPTRTGTRVVALDAADGPAAGDLGHVARDGGARSTAACPTPSARRTPASATRWSAR